MIIYAYYLRNRLTQTALSQLLTVMNIHMPLDSILPKSKYLLKKGLQVKDIKSVKRHYFCPKCQRDIQINARQCQNKLCKTQLKFTRLKRKGYFYLHRNVRECLQTTMEMPTVAQDLLQRINLRNSQSKEVNHESLTDIMDGKAYQKLGMFILLK